MLTKSIEAALIASTFIFLQGASIDPDCGRTNIIIFSQKGALETLPSQYFCRTLSTSTVVWAFLCLWECGVLRKALSWSFHIASLWVYPVNQAKKMWSTSRIFLFTRAQNMCSLNPIIALGPLYNFIWRRLHTYFQKYWWWGCWRMPSCFG